MIPDSVADRRRLPNGSRPGFVLANPPVMKTNPRVAAPQKVVLKRRYRILVVDDDQDPRELVASALIAMGYAVEVAADGFEAVAKLQETMADLVLTDLMMPGMHGVDLAQWIRTYRPGLPLIVID